MLCRGSDGRDIPFQPVDIECFSYLLYVALEIKLYAMDRILHKSLIFTFGIVPHKIPTKQFPVDFFVKYKRERRNGRRTYVRLYEHIPIITGKNQHKKGMQ